MDALSCVALLISGLIYIFFLLSKNDSLHDKARKLQTELDKTTSEVSLLRKKNDEYELLLSSFKNIIPSEANENNDSQENHMLCSKEIIDVLVNIEVKKAIIEYLRTENKSYYTYDQIERQTNIQKIKNQIYNCEDELLEYKQLYRKHLTSNLTAIPYSAKIIADFETHGIELLARALNWGSDQKRLKKVASIREIRKEAVSLITKSKEAEYQLAYAIEMFPALEDFLNSDYNDLPSVDFSCLVSENHDGVRNYLSSEEYAQLSTVERNQLALDRYIESHRKSNWQIGRDYELYVGYRYEKKGYRVEYYGSTNKLEDLGRDLIARREGTTLIIQCKYWSAKKQIHEKHINQLYGTMMCYCFENNVPTESVRGLLVTNIMLSETARKFAKYLGIEVVENYALGNYPRIKCNINHDESGTKTKIYHLPFDQQYDACKIDMPGEFMAMTVEEAEKAGFRRAYRWHSN